MLDQKLLIEMQEYIQNQLAPVEHALQAARIYNSDADNIIEDTIENFIEQNRKPTFRETLFHYIDATGESDAVIYNRAGIDRKLFSKIRSNDNYHPRKNTILSLALSLQLNKSDTIKLLNTAGYSLSDSDTSDLVIQFCLDKEIYNIHYVNQALDHFKLKPLNGLI